MITHARKNALRPTGIVYFLINLGRTSTIKNRPLYIICMISTGLNSKGFFNPRAELIPIAIQYAPIIFIESLVSYAFENTSCGALVVKNRATVPTTPVTRIFKMYITCMNVKEGS